MFNKIKFQFIFFILLFIKASIAFSIEPSLRFQHITIEDGLPQNSVFSIFQDSSGFLWFGTQDGLVRYDGYDLKVFQNNSGNPYSLSGNFISSIVEDNQGNLWIGTRGNGLNLFNTKSEKFTNYRNNINDPNSLSHDVVRCITEDSQGNLWIGTEGGGLNLFNPQKEQFIHYKHKSNASSGFNDNVYSIIEGEKGFLWLGAEGKLSHFNTKTKQFTLYSPKNLNVTTKSTNPIFNLIKDRLGNLWLSTGGNGLNHFDTQKKQFTYYLHQVNEPNSLGDNIVYTIAEDNLGNLWLGTGGGLDYFNTVTKQFRHFVHQTAAPNGLSDNDVRVITEDNQGNFWIGTHNGGINKFNPKIVQFTHYNQQVNGLSSKNVWSFAEDKQNNIWIGTFNGGLNLLNTSTGRFTHYLHQNNDINSLSNDVIYSIAVDEKNNLWIGGREGLNHFNITTDKFTHYRHKTGDPNSISADIIFSIIVDSDENLWLGTKGGGLNHFNTKTKQFKHYRHREGDKQSLSNDDVFSLAEDHLGNIWVGTNGGGLNHFNTKTELFTHYYHQDYDSTTLSDSSVYSVFEDSQNNIWIGTRNGLNLFNTKNDSFNHFTTDNGLPNNVIYRIEEDNLGYLWISTNQGMSRFEPKTKNFKNYDTGDGLQSNEFTFGASFKSKAGELFFGGINGFNRFHPERITDDKQPPKVLITEMLLSNKRVPVGTVNPHITEKNKDHFSLKEVIHKTRAITLTHTDNIISFEFAALHFANPQKNQFTYQLIGWDKDWVSTDYKNRRATYTNLPDGNYTFRVKASNADGYWNEEGASLKITVLPPLWKTWWAYSLYCLIFIFLIIRFVTSQREKVAKAREVSLQLEQKVTERTKNIHMLAEIGKEISANLDFDAIIEDVYRHVDTLMDATIFALGVYKKGANTIEFIKPYKNNVLCKPYTRDMNNKNQFAVKCIETKEMIFSNDVRNEKEELVKSLIVREQNEMPNSLMYIPLIIEGDVHGVLGVQSYKKQAYDKNHIELLRNIASYTSIAIANANAHQKLIEAQSQLVLAEKMAGLGTLTAGVAHEINNPTNFTHAAVYMMQDEIKEIKAFLIQLAGGENADKEVLDSFEQKFAKLIELTNTATEGTKRIKTIVNNLRSFSRLDDDTKQQSQVVNLLTSTIALVKTQYNSINIELKADDNYDSSSLVSCFPAKLSQVFMNTIINACQAIEVRQQDYPELVGKITINLTATENQLEITFKDNGCGMDESIKVKVFEPFFTTKDVGDGTGLGMAISFGIIEEHGGTITIESTINQGTHLTVSLPC